MAASNPDLARKIGVKNIDDYVLNKDFLRSKQIISYGIEYTMSSTYDGTKNLMKKVKEHIYIYRSEEAYSNTLFIIHPFFLHLTDYHHFDEGKLPKKKEEADTYLNNLLNTLERVKERDIGVVAIEDAYFYAALTSIFMERGLIQDVIISTAGGGNFQFPKEVSLKKYGNRNTFIAGGYNGACLKSSLFEIKDMIPYSQMRFVKELIVDDPERMKETLVPDEIPYDLDNTKTYKIHTKDRRVITIDQMIDIIDTGLMIPPELSNLTQTRFGVGFY